MRFEGTMSSHSSMSDCDFVPLTDADVESSIPEVFERRKLRFDERIAIQSAARSYTYPALNHAANRIAYAILEKLGHGNDPIAILIDDTAQAVVALLSALKAGKLYLPLDLTFPLSHLQYLVDDSRARLVVAETKTLALAQQLLSQRSTPILNIDVLPDQAAGAADNPLLSIDPDSLASLLYTSGSTAKPKGVVQNHRNLLHLARRYTEGYHVTPADRIALLRTLTVSGGTLHMLGALMNGACLVPYNLKRDGIAGLAPWLNAHRITLCSFGPKLVRSLAEITEPPDRMTTLRSVTLSGEPLYKSDIELCRRLFSPDCVLVNSLGATEAPMSVRYTIDQSRLKGNLVPVGFPTDGVTVGLRGKNGEPVDAGEAGEIVLQSRHLAVGYWENDELTRAKFLPAADRRDERIYLTGDLGRFLPDGALIHLGRKDDVVKVRGYRIGLAEVEAALLEHLGVAEAAVVARDAADADNDLVAYIVPRAAGAATVPELIAFLQARLPDFMVPAQFIFMTQFPVINNKLDRKALPRLPRSRRDANQPYTPPSNTLEIAIAEIWESVLRIAPIGVHDEFLHLGGDSLQAGKIIARMNNSLNCNVSITSFFDAKTIAGLADLLLSSPRIS